VSDKSLWGDLSELAPERTPFLLLQEQANYLQGATNEILEGRAQRQMSTVGKKVNATLDVVAPALQRYYIAILGLTYDASMLYPVDVEDFLSGVVRAASSEDELKKLLREILTSDDVRTILANLIAESQFSQRV